MLEIESAGKTSSANLLDTVPRLKRTLEE